MLISISLLQLIGLSKHAEVHSQTTELLLEGVGGLAQYLGEMPLWVESNEVAQAWLRLPFLVEGLSRTDSGLQYIEIKRDGVTLFHRQAGDRLAEEGEESEAVGAPPDIDVSYEAIDNFGEEIPVIVYRRRRAQPDGSWLEVELGIRREAVAGRERTAVQAMRWMLRLAILVLVLAVMLSVAVTVLAVRHDRRLEQRQRQEEHLFYSGMVANSIVHDFRNPMSAVKLDAQMLEREAAKETMRPERLGELAGRITRTLERLDNIFKEFLFLSRPAEADAGGQIELVACLHECLDTLAARIEQKELVVVADLPDGDALAEGSEPALRRAMINVLQNAIQHSPRGGEVGVSLERDRGGHWLIRVSDKGPGIPPALRKEIFEMFFTTQPEGTGLGLFIARAALANCGGTIEVSDGSGGAELRIVMRSAKS